MKCLEKSNEQQEALDTLFIHECISKCNLSFKKSKTYFTESLNLQENLDMDKIELSVINLKDSIKYSNNKCIEQEAQAYSYLG